MKYSFIQNKLHQPDQEELTVGKLTFSVGPNETWTNVIALALASEGESSQAAKTLTINITELPMGNKLRSIRQLPMAIITLAMHRS